MSVLLASPKISVAGGKSEVGVETATVISEKLITFRDENMSLTRATRIILENDYNVAPASHWTYNGKSLRDIYNETYQAPE